MARFFKIKTLMEEIRANGIKQTTGQFVVKNSSGKVTAACAVGMGAVNLGIDWDDLNSALCRITVNSIHGTTLAAVITNLNDQNKWSFDKIATYVENTFPELMHLRIDAKELNYKI